MAIYFVPGIGEVALVATGVIVVAGVTYYAGSAIYERIMDWIEYQEYMKRWFQLIDKKYGNHGNEFKNRPGGNGRKPSKEEYFNMAMTFKAVQTGGQIYSKMDPDNADRIIKFNAKTLEYLVYYRNTGQIMTYYLPKWSEYQKTGDLARWIDAALHYYMEK